MIGKHSTALVIGNVDNLASGVIENLRDEGFDVITLSSLNRDNIFNHAYAIAEMKSIRSTCSEHRKVDLILNFIDYRVGLDWWYYAYLKELINLTLTELEVAENVAMFNLYAVAEYANYAGDYNPYQLTSVFKTSMWESEIEITSISYELGKAKAEYITDSIATLLEQEYLACGYSLVRHLLFERADGGLRTLITDLELDSVI